MKRHPILIEYSRDHHKILSLAHYILKHPEEALYEKIKSNQEDLLSHFEKEEVCFSDYWQNLANPILKKRFMDEHRQIRDLLHQANQTETWVLLAQALINHIRFEERELFPEIEKNCLL